MGMENSKQSEIEKLSESKNAEDLARASMGYAIMSIHAKNIDAAKIYGDRAFELAVLSHYQGSQDAFDLMRSFSALDWPGENPKHRLQRFQSFAPLSEE